MQMDQATQQNAALVEEMAAAASSLKTQSHDLVQVVAAFKLSASDTNAVPSRVAVRSNVPRSTPFTGRERRVQDLGSALARGTAAESPSHATGAAPVAAARAAAPAASAPPASPAATAKVAAMASESDWETF